MFTYRTDSVIVVEVEYILCHVWVEPEEEHTRIGQETASDYHIVQVGRTHLDKPTSTTK